MAKQRKKAYEVLVLFHEEVVKEYGVTDIETKIVVQPTVILAANDQEAAFAAHRLVPEAEAQKQEWIDVRIRNF